MDYIISVVFSLIALKYILLGSDFSFTYWYRYREEYLTWYFNRDTFKDYLIDKEYDL